MYEQKTRNMRPAAAQDLALRMLVAIALITGRPADKETALDEIRASLTTRKGKADVRARYSWLAGRVLRERLLMNDVRGGIQEPDGPPPPTPKPKSKKKRPKGTSGGRRCARCQHLQRDHITTGCLVCFQCPAYQEKKSTKPDPLCRCNHRESSHRDRRGPCAKQPCQCRAFRAQRDLPAETSSSVRTVPGGGVESNRRRH